MGTMRTRKLHTAIQWIPGTVVTIEMISPTLETEERGFFFFLLLLPIKKVKDR